jgi:hypothetical protein
MVQVISKNTHRDTTQSLRNDFIFTCLEDRGIFRSKSDKNVITPRPSSVWFTFLIKYIIYGLFD